MPSCAPTAPCCAADAAGAGLLADAGPTEDGAEGGGAADQDAGPSVARPAAVSRWLVAEEEEEEEGAGAPAAGAPAAKVRARLSCRAPCTAAEQARLTLTLTLP
jgi:hypothetical protein